MSDTITPDPIIVCHACACLITNGDYSGDHFDARGPAWRCDRLDTFLANAARIWPVVTSAEALEGHHEDCEVCGDPDPMGWVHTVVTSPDTRCEPCRVFEGHDACPLVDDSCPCCALQLTVHPDDTDDHGRAI